MVKSKINQGMSISGFTFVKNAQKLYYPVKESILSILPIVDEFVIALGKSDPGDNTLALLRSIDSDKIKIIETEWDQTRYPRGSVYAQQTDVAKAHCNGDWLIYLQADEVVHDQDLQLIQNACNAYYLNPDVEGFVLKYIHFWGDYKHTASGHAWYNREVRMVRNLPQIHSWRDAQSFRYHLEPFDNDYFKKVHTRPLKTILLDARVFHYGWVRPPQIIKIKNDEVRKNYKADLWKEYDLYFDFGRMDQYEEYNGNHPVIMTERIKKLDWSHLLRTSGPLILNRSKLKHEKWKYQFLTIIEKLFFKGNKIGGFTNYTTIKKMEG